MYLENSSQAINKGIKIGYVSITKGIGIYKITVDAP